MPNTQPDRFDIAIVGGGPAGYVAAIRAAQLGAHTAVVEQRDLGGTCLNRGCIPSKALIKCAELLQMAESAKRFGIDFGPPDINLKRVRAHKDRAVKLLVSGVTTLMKANNVEVFTGHGRLASANEVLITSDQQTTELSADQIVLATGSVPLQLPIPGADGDNIFTSDEVVDLPGPPESLVIVGAGYVGCEFAQIYAAFGTSVTIIEMLDRVMPAEDPQASEVLARALRRNGVEIYCQSKVISISDAEGEKRIEYEQDGNSQVVETDMILMAAGRRAFTQDLGLEEVGIQTDRGRIQVDETLQTNIAGIYAAGDCLRGAGLAHLASHEGIAAVENALGEGGQVNYDAVPGCIFTHPEIASVGVQEHQAQDQELGITIGQFPFAAVGKAAAIGEREGFVKLIAEAGSNRIIGGTIVGPSATELIAEVVLAIQTQQTLDEVAETIHSHPTMAEAIGEAALAGLGRALHLPPK